MSKTKGKIQETFLCGPFHVAPAHSVAVHFLPGQTPCPLLAVASPAQMIE